jgi:serine/threonine protein kinase
MALTASRSPQTLGNYDILEMIAQGGMGCVYKGRNRLTGEVVAIKTYAPGKTADTVLLKRFQQESQVARSLDHPHIVRGLEFGHHEGIFYLAMEYVDGRSLAEHIKTQGRLPEAEAVRLICQVAQAVHQAHLQGIVHRDIKPGNILLTAAGQAKLTDLGVVRQIHSGAGLTHQLDWLGTPNFMAPEQFHSARDADALCDVYSLGATLYMAVTGKVPFPARSLAQVMTLKIKNQFAPPRQLVPSLSPHVDRAILRAMSPEPQHRPESCAEFIKDLTDPAAPQTAENKPPTRGRSFAGTERRATVRFPMNRDSACQPIGGESELSWPARVQNISRGGLCLHLDRRFEPRTILTVEFGDAAELPRCPLLVRVVRTRKLSSNKWELGCTFGRKLGADEVQTLLGDSTEQA